MALAIQGLGWGSHLVTQRRIWRPCAANSPDAPRATHAPAPCARHHGNSPGSVHAPTSDVVRRLCWLCDRPVLNSTSGVGRSSDRGEKPLHSTGTCVTFGASFTGPPSGPIMQHQQVSPGTLQRGPKAPAKRIEQEQRRSVRKISPKKTDEEKPARSHRQIQCIIRTPLTTLTVIPTSSSKESARTTKSRPANTASKSRLRARPAVP